jgi:hypothetical protein
MSGGCKRVHEWSWSEQKQVTRYVSYLTKLPAGHYSRTLQQRQDKEN